MLERTLADTVPAFFFIRDNKKQKTGCLMAAGTYTNLVETYGSILNVGVC